MEVLQKILTEYDKIIELVSFLFYIFISVLLFIRTKDVSLMKELKKEIGEYIEMYRTESDALKDVKNISQSFDKMKSVYRLNKVSNELELDENKIDIHELIQSASDTALDKILDRFIPVDSTSELVGELNHTLDKLDIALEGSSIAEEYREKLGLAPELSQAEVFEYMRKYSKDLQSKIEQAQKKLAEREKIKKEIIDDEKTPIEESK